MAILSNKQVDAVIAEIKKATAKDAYKLSLVDGKPTVMSSKIGGLPYWPCGMDFPTPDILDGSARFALLAQLNLADFGGDPRLPSSGMLQFFVATDDLMGLDFDHPDSQKGFRVIWHEDVRTDKCVSKPGEIGILPGETDEMFPIERECLLKIGKAQSHITTADYRFEEVFAVAYETVSGKPLDEDASWFDAMDDEGADRVWKELGVPEPAHLVFGWPFFTQTDPREYNDDLRVYDTLLLQLDTDCRERDSILWGDSGVGNFFMPGDALSNKDFSRVMYNWDCY